MATEADIPVMDERQWSRIGRLFDRLLEGADPDSTLASEPDPKIRAAALQLWQHHVRAGEENYLEAPLEFQVAPVFQPGQTVLNRFRIEKKLGSGGMGEVYLAWDGRVEDRVALKTIARLLAPSPSIRKRFVAEVQNARRVTHPNVCRIHELFDDGATVFFSMEYVDGAPLPEFAAGGLPAALGRSIVRQLAEGLGAAHRIGVVHGDFKPANVMVVRGTPEARTLRAVIMDFGLARGLDHGVSGDEGFSVRAGTADYMAPELMAGGAPTIRSDIYAFGKVAGELLPKERLWDECTRTPPEERPASLDAIARHLEPRSSRRYWIAAAAIASAGAASYALRGPVRGGINVAAGARILVNGFRAAAAHVPGARLARSLILTALRQSPRIHAIADEDLLPALRRLDPGGTLPIAGRVLQDLMRRLNAAFWIEGDLRQVAGRYSLDLRLQAASGQQGMEATFRDEPSAVALAQTAAGWVRRAAGESGRSLEVNPAEVGRYTSEVPEALQKYYDAMEHYALAEMDLAVPLLEEAVRLDPNFAQAHHMLGLTVDSAGEYDRGFREIELAMRLAQRLPERERTSVEASYYRMVQDPVKMIAAARQNLLYHPDEPRALAAMGERLVYIGKAAEANSGEDAVSFHRRAVALAPDDWMQVLRLDYALIEGGRFPEAVQEFQVAQGRGMANAWLYNPLGYSYMGLERYEEALEAFGKEPVDGDSACDIPAARLMQGHFEPAIAAFEELRAKAKNPIDAHHANEFLCGLYFVTDRPERARRQVRELADLPAYPPMACYLACSASLARRLNDDETLAEVHDLTSQIAGRWQNDYTQAIEMHARALQLWRRNQLDEAEQLLQQSDGKSVNIWTLFDLAELYTRRGKYELAEEYWKKFEARRGTVLVQRWFSGLIVMGWLYHASAAQALQHRETAFQYAKKVLDHWLPNNAGLRIVQAAQNIHAVSKPI